MLRSSHPDVFFEKGILRNFSKFTGKYLCQSLIFNKTAGGTCNFIKKETLAQVLSCEFYEISKNTFFTEHLWWPPRLYVGVPLEFEAALVENFAFLIFQNIADTETVPQRCPIKRCSIERKTPEI